MKFGVNVIVFLFMPTLYCLTLTLTTFPTNRISVVYLTTFYRFLYLPASVIEFFFRTDTKHLKSAVAFLGVMNPITYTTDINAKNESDSGFKVFSIGTEEEFNYRRRQIQEAVKRCQINNRYSVGGKGRKRKCQAIEHWHEKENNYVDTKLHTYSRMLVDAAIKYKCDTIYLMRQEPREDKAKEDNKDKEPFVLRNWSYFGLKQKIEYKAKMYGITLKEEK